MRASVVRGADGKFYIAPLRVGLNGASFPTEREAQYVVDAVNAAYNDGAESVRVELRNLIGVTND